MIRFLQGIVKSTEDRAIILFVNGIGYQVLVTNNLLIEPEEEIELYIHSHIREDQFTLYGFRTKKELNFFELLLTINGVGPKMALEILNENPEKIQNAILNKDIACLTKIPGVGKKIAERICLELQNKVMPENTDNYSPTPQREFDETVIMTLETLGYKRNHINKVLSEIEEETKEAEELIRLFLQRV